jgi:hypothetical protein
MAHPTQNQAPFWFAPEAASVIEKRSPLKKYRGDNGPDAHRI